MGMGNDKGIKWIVWITTLILVGLEIYSLTTDSHYKWDFIFLMGLLWGVYFLQGKIRLHWFHFLLFSVFLVVHNLGTFGTYKVFLLGMEYDFWVHSYFGLVSALMLYRTYSAVGPYKNRWFMIVAVVAVVLGFSAFHELFEYGGAVLLGEGEGVLFVGAGDIDEWDTQKDMRNNLLGALIGLGIYLVLDKIKGKKEIG
jgi:uncharacterized membrane protein YjdF